MLFKTLYVATAANSRLTADFLDLVGLWRPARAAPQRTAMVKLFCVHLSDPGAGALLRLPRAQALIKAGGIAQALMLPLIAGATLYLRGRDTDRRVGPIFLTDIFTWLAFFAITAVAAYSVFELFQDFDTRWVVNAVDGRPRSAGRHRVRIGVPTMFQHPGSLPNARRDVSLVASDSTERSIVRRRSRSHRDRALC